MPHKMQHHPAYISWRCMRSRCNNPNVDGWRKYGARGIHVCDKWKVFNLFWEDMGSTWKNGLTIDRIDTYGNYEPSNCRWVTPKQQANNMRTNVFINTKWGRLPLAEAADKAGLSYFTVATRRYNGWSEGQLLIPRR